MGSGTLFSLIFLLFGLTKSGVAIYFTESGNFTFTPRFWPEINHPVHTFTALLEPDDTGHVTYSIIRPKNSICPQISIHPQLGNVEILAGRYGESVVTTKSKKFLDEKCVYNVTAVLEGRPGARKTRKDKISLQLSNFFFPNTPTTGPSQDTICRQLSQEILCFGEINLLQLSIMENSLSLPISQLGKFNKFCGLYTVNYTIVSEVLSIHGTDDADEGGGFTIWAQEGLDREDEPFYDFSVTCHLTPNARSRALFNDTAPTSSVTIPGRLSILDQNDSPVESQDGEKLVTVFVTLSNDKFLNGSRVTPDGIHGVLIAQDSDTVDVNRIVMSSVNDTLGLLEFTLKSSAINLKHLNGSRNINATFALPVIKFTENVSTTHRWDGDYCVAANLTDDSQVVKHPPLTYVICMGWEGGRRDLNNSTTINGSTIAATTFSQPERERFPNRRLPTSGDNNGASIDATNTEDHVTYKTFDGKLGVFESAEPECGRGCIVLYSSVSVAIMLVVLGLILAVWRRQGYKKRKSPQSPVVDPSDMELSGNGFGDRGGGNRILLPDAEYASSGLATHRTSGFFQPNANAQFNPDNFFQVESKWEIPAEDLILDHVVGEGEFGRVLKGLMRTAAGTVHVAVKMLKVDETDGNKSLRQEFMAEFSLLKQLDHTNVIKLLGASTSNRGIPLLVMEYAEFGSLRSFLRKCRRVEKINHVCDKSEWCEMRSSGGESGGNGHFRNSTEICDYFVTPQEVLGFSWQIAKGMAYLSDMKMVHRDLAARNVLITKTKMCKISDFGLTRDIYVDDAYKKKSKDRVPVKWLAPECLTDELYTSKSDVWAFGVLLWELAMLGQSPYPGIQSELLYSLLDSGYRMPQPPGCSNEVYSVMKKCWAKVPSDRPTFHELVFELSRLLEDGIEYLQLDIPSVSNPGYDIFNQNVAPPITTLPSAPSERPARRNSSMENLRLIDYEISTNDEFVGARPPIMSTFSQKLPHTYINELKSSQDGCEKRSKDNKHHEPINSSSGYESPITLSNG